MDGWEELRAAVPRTITVAGVEVGRGSRLALRPGTGADVFERALAGQVGIVETIHQDVEGRFQLVVTLEDDPGRDLGQARRHGHRFFFSPEEVEPLAGPAPPRTRVLVAGIGNIFMADDGFGVEVARRLGARDLAPGIDVVDFGIRGMDLVYALGEGYDAAVFVDAIPRGGAPGTLYLIEADVEGTEPTLDVHGMDPVKVLVLARELGPVPERVLVVGCEPQVRMTGDEEDVVVALSPPVLAAVDEAVAMVESVLEDLVTTEDNERKVSRSWASS